MFVRTSSLKLKVLYTLALFISCFPAVTSQRLMGISGEDCVDQAYDGLQKFWCAQNECNVNLCSSSYQNWLFTNLLSICSHSWPGDDVGAYSASKCSGGTTTSPSSTGPHEKGGTILGSWSPSVLILVTPIVLSIAFGFHLVA